MHRSGLLVLLMMCSASCLTDVGAIGDGAGGESDAPATPEGPFVGMSMTAIAEQLGVAKDAISALSDCQRGCMAFARTGCQHALSECKGHEDDEEETACASADDGTEYVTPCPNALMLSCGGIIVQHQCLEACRGQHR